MTGYRGDFHFAISRQATAKKICSQREWAVLRAALLRRWHNESMRALRKLTAGPGLHMCEIPEPIPGPNEVKIRVMRTGLCGTDLHLFTFDGGAPGTLNLPQTLGHEFYGEIVEIGSAVEQGDGPDQLHLGQRVSVEGHVVCGRCRNCRAGRRHMCVRAEGIGVNRDGAFADYVTVPSANIWVQSRAIDPELGALFDPFGNAVHTCQQVQLTGQDVLITGAGPIGVMCAAIARHAGARHVVITDINPDRLHLAECAEPDRIVNTQTDDLREVMAQLKIREGFDVGLEMSGAPGGMASLLEHCNHGATLALLGLPAREFPVNWNRVITHMLTIKGVYGREMFDTWYLATFMLQTSDWLREAVRGVITHRLSPDQWEDAFAHLGSSRAGKIIINWEE